MQTGPVQPWVRWADRPLFCRMNWRRVVRGAGRGRFAGRQRHPDAVPPRCLGGHRRGHGRGHRALPPLQPAVPAEDDQCGLDLFSSSNADALEDHLAANGYSDLSSVDYLTLVIRCPINTIRGLQTKRWVNGVYLDILLVSAPDADMAWAHGRGRIRGARLRAQPHVDPRSAPRMGPRPAHSVECNEEDLGAGCHNIGTATSASWATPPGSTPRDCRATLDPATRRSIPRMSCTSRSRVRPPSRPSTTGRPMLAGR